MSTPEIPIGGRRKYAVESIYDAFSPDALQELNDYLSIIHPLTRLIQQRSGMSTVASAATIAIPNGADVVSVTGTTTITSVTAGYAGQRVTLVFAGALTFTDGSNLKLAGNLVTTADDTISLVCDGTIWFETGRSVN